MANPRQRSETGGRTSRHPMLDPRVGTGPRWTEKLTDRPRREPRQPTDISIPISGLDKHRPPGRRPPLHRTSQIGITQRMSAGPTYPLDRRTSISTWVMRRPPERAAKPYRPRPSTGVRPKRALCWRFDLHHLVRTFPFPFAVYAPSVGTQGGRQSRCLAKRPSRPRAKAASLREWEPQ